MDFIEWCSFVLNRLVELSQATSESRLSGISRYEFAGAICGQPLAVQPEYWTSECGKGLETALDEMEKLGVVEHPNSHQYRWKPSRDGQALSTNIIPLWERICQIRIETEPKQLLITINRLTHKSSNEHAWLEPVDRDTLINELGWPERLFWSALQELEQLDFVHCPGIAGNIKVRSTYQGLVWELRRGFTSESKFIDDLLAEWETTNVDFKRELYLDTADQKAEFVKDIIGLANTKASGRRWMIIGFDDKTRSYHKPPDTKVTQNRFEQLLFRYTTPMIQVRYAVVDYRVGRVGKLEVLRDPGSLPYSVMESIGDKKRITQGQVFVRHGSQTEQPTAAEEQALRDEGDRARKHI